uniref:Putative tail protein n=1 Tax=viral metagenome TaxID=1070528 RepID=A0A6H1ZN78_9ZZZZ
MALKKIRIGSAEDIFQYDDGAFPVAIHTEGPMQSDTAPSAANEVVRLTDITLMVDGPAGPVVDSNIAEFDGVTGQKIKDGGLAHVDVADAITKKHTQGTDTALGALGTKNPPIDADKVIYRDSAAADGLVTSTWAQVKAFLKTYFDTLYESLGTVTSVGALPIYANNAAAVAGGLAVNDLYRTGADPDVVCVVH